jgi:hypothetical protein
MGRLAVCVEYEFIAFLDSATLNAAGRAGDGSALLHRRRAALGSLSSVALPSAAAAKFYHNWTAQTIVASGASARSSPAARRGPVAVRPIG